MGLMVEMGRLAKKDDFFLSQNIAELYQIHQFFKMQKDKKRENVHRFLWQSPLIVLHIFP